MSMELRWFFRGSLPASVLEWGLKKGFFPEESRTDIYLNLQNTDLGVKIRKGENFEIKYRLSSESFQLENNQISGFVEKWKKSSTPLKSAAADPLNAIKGPQISVKKTRYLQRFSVDPATKKVEPSEGRLKEGLIMEVTDLSAVKGKGSEFKYWTICFDALGDKQKETLQFGVSNILADYPLSKPQETNSFSYPAFIQII